MNRVMLGIGLIAALAIGSGALLAEEKADKAAKKETAPRVLVPFSKLTLTEDQKKQIAAVQSDYAGKVKALQAEERTKIETLLTADQKKELAKIEEDAAKRRAEYAKKYRERKAAEGDDDAPEAADKP